jgi:RHS repeat-associated protein
MSQWRGTADAPVEDLFEYDSLGRLTAQRHADGTSTEWYYDNDLTRSEITRADELRHRYTTFLDADGQVVEVAGFRSSGVPPSKTLYDYNPVGELTDVRDGVGTRTKYDWDERGDLRSSDDPNRGKWVYEDYDRTGHVRLVIDPDDNWTRFRYDKLGRPSYKEFESGRELRWLYDEPGRGASIGKLTSVVDTSAAGCPFKAGGGFTVDERSYDALGRLEKRSVCIDGKTLTWSFSFDVLNRLHTMTYPDGEVVTYGYDVAGRVSSVSGILTEMLYSPDGQPSVVRFANGVTETREYDPTRRWLNSQKTLEGSKVLEHNVYTHYANGLIRSFESRTAHTAFVATYDGANQLTDVTGDLDIHWQYDSSGNMTYNSSVGTYSYTYSDPARGCGTAPVIACPHAVKTAGNSEFSYDRQGRLLSVVRAPGGEKRTVDWNRDGEPFRFTDEHGTQTEMRYGANGQRVSRKRMGAVTLFYGDLADVQYAPNANSGNVTQYYYAGSRLLGAKDANGRYWFHTDHVGSPLVLTDANGDAIARYDYEPYGRMATGAVAGDRNTIHFGGFYDDGENGLIYMNARYYDPGYGRFISPDPTLLSSYHAHAANRYAYAYNSPLNFIDPTGLDAFDAGVEQQFGGSLASGGDSWNGMPIVGAGTAEPPEGLTAGEFAQLPPAEQARLVNGVPLQSLRVAVPEGSSVSRSLSSEEINEMNVQLIEMSIDAIMPILTGGVGSGITRVSVGRPVRASPVAGSIRNVNPTGGQANCVNCAVATNATLSGRPASALPGVVTPIAALAKVFKAKWINVAGRTQIEQILLKAGPGSQAIVFGARGTGVGHVWNAVNQKGVIRFLDGQIGGQASFQGYTSFQLLMVPRGTSGWQIVIAP